MTTALGILQTAANRLGIPAPSAYSSNTQLLHLLYEVCEDLRNTRAFRQQVRTHTLTLTAARDSYPLPSDFYSGLLGTHYNQTTSIGLIGPLDDSIWNYMLYGVGGASVNYSFNVRGPDLNPSSTGGQFTLSPTPTATDTISFDYITKHYFVPSTYAVASLASTITADSDICIFDDDVLIQGLKYKYREAKGLDYSDPKDAFERYKESAVSRWHGSTVHGFPSRRSSLPRYRVPDGSWSL